MTCRESREYLYAFLDNELESGLSIDFQRHIEHCPHCAREVEIEREIKRQLNRMLREDVASGAERGQAAEMLVEVVTRQPKNRFWRRANQLIAATAAIFAVGLFFWMYDNAEPTRSEPTFAEVLVDDMEHLLQKEQRVQIASADVTTVEDWLLAKTSLLITLPRTEERFKLLGGRTCSISGQTVAFALYRKGDHFSSLIALTADDDQLAGMDYIESDGRSYHVGRCREHTIVACRRGDLLYAAVGQHSETELMSLMPEGPHESD